MRKSFVYFGVLICGALLLLSGYIVYFGLHDSIEKADVIVIFGNTVNPDGSLSLRLRARMDRGIELFKDGKGEYVFVSGSLGKEGVEESGAMEAYAIRQGVPKENVIRDPKGVDTEATVKHAAEFLVQKNLKSVLAVSQFFHLARVDLAFANQGIVHRGHAHAHFYEFRDVYSFMRELVALPVYLIQSK